MALSKTLHRASPYLVGIGLGIALRDFGRTAKLPSTVVRLSWISSLCGLIWCFWEPAHLASRTYQYESAEAAQYAGLSPLVFSLSLAWIIFACNFGYGTTLNRLLSSTPMVFISRLSYAIYLLEFIVFFTFAARQRHTEHFELAKYVNSVELMTLIAAALILTLVIDLPMQNIRRMLLSAMTPRESSAQPDLMPQTKEKELFKDIIQEENEEEEFDDEEQSPTAGGHGRSSNPETPKRSAESAKIVSSWDDSEAYVPQFRNVANDSDNSKRMSPREYFKSSFDENTATPSPHWSSTR